MNVTVENLAPCKKLVRVEVDAQKVDEAFESITKDFQKHAALPGFRPGKAPRDMVLRKYDKDIQDEAKRKLISDAYRDAVKEHKLEVLGYPDIEEIQFGPRQAAAVCGDDRDGAGVRAARYKGLPVKREARTVTDEDVERALDVLRAAAGELQDRGASDAGRRHRGGELHRHVRRQADHGHRADGAGV